MTIKNLPSFGKAALMGAVALVAVWGGLAGGGGVLAELGSGRHAAGGGAVAGWQEAIGTAAAEDPHAASAFTGDAVRQDESGRGSLAGLLLSMASGDLLWTPLKPPGSLPERELALGDSQSQFMAPPSVNWPVAVGKAKQPDEAASTSKAVFDNEYGGSSVDEQDGEDDPPAVDANAIPALDQKEETRSYNKKYKNDGSSPLAGLRGFVALGDLLWTPLKEVDAPGSLPKNELALGDALDLVPGDAERLEALNEKQQSSAALVDNGQQAKDGAYDGTTPSEWSFMGWKWPVLPSALWPGVVGKANDNRPEEVGGASGDAGSYSLVSAPGDRTEGVRESDEAKEAKEASALVEEDDSPVANAIPALDQNDDVRNEKSGGSSVEGYEARPLAIDAQGEVQKQEKGTRLYDKIYKNRGHSVAVLLRCAFWAHDLVAGGSFFKNALSSGHSLVSALGDTTEGVTGGDMAEEAKEESALVEEGGQPRDGVSTTKAIRDENYGGSSIKGYEDPLTIDALGETHTRQEVDGRGRSALQQTGSIKWALKKLKKDKIWSKLDSDAALDWAQPSRTRSAEEVEETPSWLLPRYDEMEDAATDGREEDSVFEEEEPMQEENEDEDSQVPSWSPSLSPEMTAAAPRKAEENHLPLADLLGGTAKAKTSLADVCLGGGNKARSVSLLVSSKAYETSLVGPGTTEGGYTVQTLGGFCILSGIALTLFASCIVLVRALTRGGADLGTSARKKKTMPRSAISQFKTYGMLLLLSINAHPTSAGLADELFEILKDWGNATFNCWAESIEEYKEDVVEPLTSKTGFYPFEYENVAGCNTLPLRRSTVPNEADMKFNYFQANTVVLQSLEILLEFFTCPLQEALSVDIDLDFTSIIRDLIFPGDIPLVDVVAENVCLADYSAPADVVLGFTPAPYKPGWTTFTLEDDTCVLGASVDSDAPCDDSGAFCCDQETGDSSGSVGSYQCLPFSGECYQETFTCLGVGVARCDLFPCCHLRNDTKVNGGVWYSQCVENVCEDPDVQNTEPDCIASGYECTSNEDCCQYSSSLTLSNAMVCYKDAGQTTGVCQRRSVRDTAYESFCIGWNAGQTLDTFGFAFPQGFPPLKVEPTGKVFQLLPTKGKIAERLFPTSSPSVCKLHKGLPIKKIPTLNAILLFQFIGFAFSFSNSLEYGANSFTRNANYENAVPLVWDGFLSVPLPPKPDMDGWVAFKLVLFPLSTWEYKKLDCQLPKGFLNRLAKSLLPGSAEAQALLDGKSSELYLSTTIEIYADFGGDGSGACVLATMSRIEIGFFGVSLIIGRGIGGWCKHDYPPSCDERTDTGSQPTSPLPIFDDECINNCDPSGFFMNLEPTLEFGTIAGGIFESFMFLAEAFQGGVTFDFDSPFDDDEDEEPSNEDETCEDLQKELNGPEGPFFQFFEDAEDFIEEEIDLEGAFSVGVFLGDDNDIKSVVFRVELPQIFIFGIPVLPSSGGLHFQWYKGSELERRRGSILRILTDTGDWHVNCPITTNGCQVWKPYQRIDPNTGDDEWNGMVEICEDSLWELDTYNRVIISQVRDPSVESFGDPPILVDRDNAPSAWYVNPQFDLTAYPDSGVTVVYLQCSLWLLGPLVTLDDLSFFVIVNTIRPEDLGASVNATETEAIIVAFENGDNETAYAGFQSQVDENSAAIDNRKRQNVYIQIELSVTALFFFSFRGAALMRNNPQGNEVFTEWVVGWSVSTFSRIPGLEASPWDWEASGTTEVFNWDNTELQGQSEARFLQDLAPPNARSVIDFQFFGLSLDEIWGAVEDYWNNSIVPFFEGIGEAIAAAFESIANILSNLADDVKLFFQSGIEFFGEQWDNFLDLFRSGGFFDDNLISPIGSRDTWISCGGSVLPCFADPCKKKYRKYRRVRTNPSNCKDTCGTTEECAQKCHDQYFCAIEYRQKADCIDFLCKRNRADECGAWVDDFSVDPFYDLQCQEDVLETLASIDDLNAEATSLSKTVEDNEQHRVKGLKYAVENPGSRQEINAAVDSQKFTVVNLDGSVMSSNVPAAADRLPILRADDINPREETNVGLQKEVIVDFQNTTQNQVTEDDLFHAFKNAFTPAAAEKVVSESVISEDLQAYGPETPTISQYNGLSQLVYNDCALGTNTRLANAWNSGTKGVIAYLLRDVHVQQSVGQVVVSPANARRRARIVNPRYTCNELLLDLQVTAELGNDVTEPLTVPITILYGDPVIVTDPERSQSIQTTCRDDDYDSESLMRLNAALPRLSRNSCPSPKLALFESDSTENEGEACTTNYTVVERTWSIASLSGDCAAPANSPTYIQTITLGGANTGLFNFDVTNATYELSNDIGSAFGVFELRDVYVDDSVIGSCGDVCNVATSPPPFVDQNLFGCDRLGENTVSVNAITDAGTSLTQQVTVQVMDPHRPTARCKDITIPVSRTITASDIDDGSFDNCGVDSMTVSKEDFTCEDIGQSVVTLQVKDKAGNTDSCVATVTVYSVEFDIKFCESTNTFGCTLSKNDDSGVVPMTVLSSEYVNASEIDIASIKLCLEGGAPCLDGQYIKSVAYEDRGRPADIGASACAINATTGVEERYLSPDGLDDLEIGWERQAVKETLLGGCSDLENSAGPTFFLTVRTADGTTIPSCPVHNVGVDQLYIKGKGKKNNLFRGG